MTFDIAMLRYIAAPEMDTVGDFDADLKVQI